MTDNLEAPPDKLRDAGKLFHDCASDIQNAIQCVNTASVEFQDSTRTSRGDYSLLDPVRRGWYDVEREILPVMKLMNDVVDKTGAALEEIATRYEERG